MKKIFVAIVAVLLAGTFQETKAQFSVGAGIAYASDISSLGISANLGYEINETWDASGSYTHFFEKDFVKWSTIDFNANYKLSEIERLGNIYAIGGVNITTVKIDIPGFTAAFGNTTESNFGVNIGAGIKVNLSEKMIFAPEMTYSISSGSYLRIGAKLMFRI